MSKLPFANQTTDQLNAQFSEAAATLREYRIAPNSRMTLATAAAAASVEVDELLAVLEERTRRAARKQARHAEFEHEEYELEFA
jgi:hypothetical protein